MITKLIYAITNSHQYTCSRGLALSCAATMCVMLLVSNWALSLESDKIQFKFLVRLHGEYNILV